ncbi:MAG: Crp/Fnr family transcriptional regulator [candidate division WOR-3 bacterium]|nr:Crp/Fnr family transcriptional regulator [candidate division WOR-3 bacterium]
MSYWEFLKESEVFNLLEDPECKAIAELAEKRKVSRGSILGKEGDKGEEFYLVIEGQLEISINAALTEPMPVAIATVGPGQISGWSSMYRDGKLTATIKAAKDSKVLVWNAQKLHEFLLRNCGMGYRILQQLLAVVARRLVNTRVALMSCVMEK